MDANYKLLWKNIIENEKSDELQCSINIPFSIASAHRAFNLNQINSNAYININGKFIHTDQVVVN